MGDLSSKFSREDIETLLDAMNDWEALGSHEWHMMTAVKNAPMPPEDHEAYEIFANVKEYFRKREKDIKESRITRQERAVFLKAKLMLVRRDMGINQLFEMATEAELPPVEGATTEAAGPDVGPIPEFTLVDSAKLERAEFFIKDLGVWDHYQKFLAEQSN